MAENGHVPTQRELGYQSESADPALSRVYGMWDSLFLIFLFFFSHPLVLPNCLKGGSGREFDHGSYPFPPIKKPTPEIDPESDKIMVAFSVKHFPQKAEPTSEKVTQSLPK